MAKRKKKSRLSERARKRKRQRIAKLSGLLVLFIFVVIGILYALLYKSVHKVDDKIICDNLYIGQVNVSGMTEKQAKAAVEKKLEEYGVLTLAMKVGEQTVEVPLQEVGLGIKDIDKLTKKAVSYGKKGTIWKRYLSMRRLKKEKKVIDETFMLDGNLAAQVIKEKAVPLEKRAVNATITHVGNGFEITDEAKGQQIEVETSIENIITYLNEKWKYDNITVELVQIEEEPEIKRADLEQIQDELSSYATEAGAGGRVTNLKRGAELLNGTVLMPGEELSVLEATLPYTEENGYVDGGAYENGEVVQSIAGGICQVSSTLYNAVLYAELEVTERSAHSMAVSYVDPSRDAAVAEGVKDFKFKNNYDAPILIEGYIDSSQRLYFAIYGKETRDEGHSVEFESETLERKEYTTKYVEDAESQIGAMNEKGSAINGRTARLWKIVYEDGKEVSRDVINNSTYQASEIKIMVGTASDNAKASAIVREAIKTQDQSKIWDAINEAKNLGSESSGEE